LPNTQNFQDKEKQQNEFSKKIEEIQKNNEENKKLYNYTLSNLEKNLAEFINAKKRVLRIIEYFSRTDMTLGLMIFLIYNLSIAFHIILFHLIYLLFSYFNIFIYFIKYQIIISK